VAAPVVVLALLTGLGAAQGSGEDPAAALLAAAAEAQARGDAAEVQRVLRAWSSRGGGGEVPEALGGPAAEARAFTAASGRLRVYASQVSPARLRVGVEDPAAVVDHLEVFGLDAAGERARLTREVAESAGRQEYRVPPGVERVRVEAVMLLAGAPVVLAWADTALGAAAGLPAGPSVTGPAPAGPAETPAPEASARVPWWWVAVGVLAAGLVGGAIWQETR
jgi:hypothetical protein